MAKLKINNKRILFLFGFITIILLLNFIISSVIKSKLTDLLLKNESEYYTAKVEDVNFKLLRRSLRLDKVLLIPKKESIANLINETSKKEAVENITLNSIELKGIGLIDIFFGKKINVNSIILNELDIHKFENSDITQKKKLKKPINLDSIYLKKLNGLEIRNIEFKNLSYQVFDFASNEITFQTNPLSFKTTGIKLEKIDEHLFKVIPAKDKFNINNINLDFEDKHYLFTIGGIAVDFEEKLVEITNVKVKPSIDKFKLANTYQFNNDIFDIELNQLKIYNFSFSKLLNNEGLFIDSLLISELDLKLFKDKRKPFNETKRPGLPHTGLKRMKFPLLVQKVKVTNSKVLLEEKLKDKDILMEVPISNLNAEISNITSIKSFREQPLNVKIDATLMNSAPMNVQAKFPLKDHQNTFYFSGTLGSSKMQLYDSALFPVLGFKVLEGEIDKLTFSASASETTSKGKMKMLYHDLVADVFKSKSNEENKFLSWTVNSLIHKSNPKKNKDPREVVMHFERVEYKGLGNYFWKTIQSGLVNTIAPGGKKAKE